MTSISFAMKMILKRLLTFLTMHLKNLTLAEKKKYEIWNYETYNSYNILTRYWKATIRHWNLEVLKDYENSRKHALSIPHKLVFLNQLIYRLSSLSDEKANEFLLLTFLKQNTFRKLTLINMI